MLSSPKNASNPSENLTTAGHERGASPLLLYDAPCPPLETTATGKTVIMRDKRGCGKHFSIIIMRCKTSKEVEAYMRESFELAGSSEQTGGIFKKRKVGLEEGLDYYDKKIAYDSLVQERF